MRKIALGICALLLATSALSLASPIVLTPPTSSNFIMGGAGGTRGDIITMTGNLTLTSIGILAEITPGYIMNFSAYVFDGTGTTQLALGPATPVLGNGNLMFYDVPISFTLLNGQSYDIGIDFNSFNDPNLGLLYFNFDPGLFGSAPFSVGPVTVTDGEERHCAQCNVLAPELELNGGLAPVIPEPSTVALVSTGVLGLLGAARRRFAV